MPSRLNKKNLAAKLPVAPRPGNSLLALLLVATVLGLGDEPARGGDREPSLRERLREALTPPPPPMEPEPAVQRCPAKDGLCYTVVLGATKCKVWRTMGRPLPPPFSYDGLSSEEYVDVDQCPKDLICEFYKSFGKGMPDGCPDDAAVPPAPKPALEVTTPTPTLFTDPEPGPSPAAPTDPRVTVPSIRTPTVKVTVPTVRTPTVKVTVPTVRTPTVKVTVPTVRTPTVKVTVPSVRTPTTPNPSAPSVHTPATLNPIPSGRTPNPASTITSREWGDQPPGGVRIDVKPEGETEQLDRNEVLKLLRKPGS
jgi:hypothetical protein